MHLLLTLLQQRTMAYIHLACFFGCQSLYFRTSKASKESGNLSPALMPPDKRHGCAQEVLCADMLPLALAYIAARCCAASCWPCFSSQWVH
jgi:hypothetical protein